MKTMYYCTIAYLGIYFSCIALPRLSAAWLCSILQLMQQCDQRPPFHRCMPQCYCQRLHACTHKVANVALMSNLPAVALLPHQPATCMRASSPNHTLGPHQTSFESFMSNLSPNELNCAIVSSILASVATSCFCRPQFYNKFQA